jgi:hypothetical protein
VEPVSEATLDMLYRFGNELQMHFKKAFCIVLKNKDQAVSRGARRFGKRSIFEDM